MSRLMIGLTGLVVCLAALAGAALAQTVPATATKPAELAVAEGDNGKTLKLGDCKIALISLAGNATTGYSWKVAKMEGDAIAQVGTVDYAADRAPRGMVGTGGTAVAKFKAVKPGETKITMEYGRPWENGVAPAKTFVVTLVVDKAP